MIHDNIIIILHKNIPACSTLFLILHRGHYIMQPPERKHFPIIFASQHSKIVNQSIISTHSNSGCTLDI